MKRNKTQIPHGKENQDNYRDKTGKVKLGRRKYCMENVSIFLKADNAEDELGKCLESAA